MGNNIACLHGSFCGIGRWVRWCLRCGAVCFGEAGGWQIPGAVPDVPVGFPVHGPHADDLTLARSVMHRLCPRAAAMSADEVDADPMAQWVACLFRMVRDGQQPLPGSLANPARELLERALGFTRWVAKHPDVGDSATSLEREERFQREALKVMGGGGEGWEGRAKSLLAATDLLEQQCRPNYLHSQQHPAAPPSLSLDRAKAFLRAWPPADQAYPDYTRDPTTLERCTAALVSLLEAAGEEDGILLRRAVGFVADVQRLEGAGDAVLDAYAKRKA